MTGVYRITNTVTDRVYIGSAVDVDHRMHQHKSDLRGGEHVNAYLQRSWDKHGEALFVFEPLVECSIETRKEREQRFIDAYVEHGLPIYNMQASAESRESFGYRHSEVTKEKMSVRQKLSWERGGRAMSKACRDAAKIVNTGRRPSDETKKRMSRSKLGHVVSEQTREKMSLSAIRRGISTDTRQKMNEALRSVRGHEVKSILGA